MHAIEVMKAQAAAPIDKELSEEERIAQQKAWQEKLRALEDRAAVLMEQLGLALPHRVRQSAG